MLRDTILIWNYGQGSDEPRAQFPDRTTGPKPFLSRPKRRLDYGTLRKDSTCQKVLPDTHASCVVNVKKPVVETNTFLSEDESTFEPIGRMYRTRIQDPLSMNTPCVRPKYGQLTLPSLSPSPPPKGVQGL
ncbi:unnamed protein product [Ectocarpus sp. 4 AP-2014]